MIEAGFVEGRKSGAFGTSIGLIVGVCMGCIFWWLTRVSIGWVIRHLKLNEAKLPLFRIVLSWILCFSVIIWIIALGISSTLATRFVISLLR